MATALRRQPTAMPMQRNLVGGRRREAAVHNLNGKHGANVHGAAAILLILLTKKWLVMTTSTAQTKRMYTAMPTMTAAAVTVTRTIANKYPA
eukprot:1260829-Pleurochrysis_carterae.AAC.1